MGFKRSLQSFLFPLVLWIEVSAISYFLWRKSLHFCLSSCHRWRMPVIDEGWFFKVPHYLCDMWYLSLCCLFGSHFICEPPENTLPLTTNLLYLISSSNSVLNVSYLLKHVKGNHTKTLYDTGGKALQSGHYEGISPLWNPSLAAFLGQQISPKSSN